MCFLLHILRSSIWCFFQYQLVTSSCLTWTVGWFYSVLQGSFSSQPDAIKGWKEQWKMQLGAWMFSGVATYWPIFIRLSEHCQENEKGNLKSNKNYTILLVYLKQTNATFLRSPRSSCRSSIHQKFRDFWLISQKGLWSSAEGHHLLSDPYFSFFFFFGGWGRVERDNINVYGSINHSALTMRSLVLCTCSNARITEAGRNRASNGRKAALQAWSGLWVPVKSQCHRSQKVCKFTSEAQLCSCFCSLYDARHC